MGKRIPTDEETRLADRLRREARATRPAFSEALHARVCRALQPCAPASPPRAGAGRMGRRWLSLAVAATLLISVVSVAWWLNRSPRSGPSPVARNVPVPPIPDPGADPDVITEPTGEIAEHLGMLVDSTVTAGQWAYLDHDAQVAVRLLMNQLPFNETSIEPL